MGRSVGARHLTRAFATGAFVFAVETATDADQRLVESLLQDVPAPTAANSEPVVFSLLRSDTAGTAWAFTSPRMPGPPTTTTLANALDILIAEVNLGALDAEPEHLHLHAAAATKAGSAVVIAAARNTGKTTSVAHLVARGWSFVTDETVRLSTETDDVSGFPKPLSIKPWGREVVDHLDAWMVPSGVDDPDAFRFVAVGASGGNVVRSGLPHLVILLRRPSDSDPSVGPIARALHPADAVVALMQETLDAERFGSAALRLAQLAASSRCFELVMGSPGETASEIDRLSGLGPVDALAVSTLPRSAAFSDGVVSIVMGDRIVVHDTESGLVFALDAGAADVWRQLGGMPVHEQVDIESPAIRPLVAQLHSLGVLAGAA